jgi:hypothetical protein
MIIRFKFFPTQIVKIKPNIKWGGQKGQIMKCAVNVNGNKTYLVEIFHGCISDWFLEGFLEKAEAWGKIL